MASGATAKYALPYPLGTDPPNVPGDVQALATALDTSMVAYLQDVIANRPAVGKAGRLFTQTDGLAGVTWRDSGAGGEWRSVGSRVQSNATNDIVQVVRAVAGQTADIWQAQDSGGGIKAQVTAAGYGIFPAGLFGGSNAVTTGPRNMFAGNGPSESIVGVRGAVSQSGNLQEWQDNTGAIRSYVDANGSFRADYGGTSALALNMGFLTGVTLNVNTGTASRVGMIIRGQASQASEFFKVQDSAGTDLLRYDYSGGLYFQNNDVYIRRGIDPQIFSAAIGSSTRAMVLRGASSGTPNVAEIQNSGGGVMSAFDYRGYLQPYPYRTDWSVGWYGASGTTNYSRVSRVGSLVLAQAKITLTASTGSMGIVLPYASAGGGGQVVGRGYRRTGNTFNEFLVMAPYGDANAYFYPGGGGGGEIFSPGWGSGDTINVTLHYFTDVGAV